MRTPRTPRAPGAGVVPPLRAAAVGCLSQVASTPRQLTAKPVVRGPQAQVSQAAAQLSQEEVSRAERAFKRHDQQGNGEADIEKFRGMCRMLELPLDGPVEKGFLERPAGDDKGVDFTSRVEKALYGSSVRSIDVTAQVNKLIMENGTQDITKQRDLCKVLWDPHPGSPKKLTVALGGITAEFLEEAAGQKPVYDLRPLLNRVAKVKGGINVDTFKRIYGEILASQTPAARQASGGNSTLRLQHMQLTEKEMRSAFEKNQTAKKGVSREGLRSCMSELGFPDHHGDLFEIYADDWFQTIGRTSQDAVLNFHEFVSAVNMLVDFCESQVQA